MKPAHDVEACMADPGFVLRLPLPSNAPESVFKIGVRKLLAIRECSVADRDKLTIEFRAWSDEIHLAFGATNAQSLG